MNYKKYTALNVVINNKMFDEKFNYEYAKAIYNAIVKGKGFICIDFNAESEEVVVKCIENENIVLIDTHIKVEKDLDVILDDDPKGYDVLNMHSVQSKYFNMDDNDNWIDITMIEDNPLFKSYMHKQTGEIRKERQPLGSSVRFLSGKWKENNE